VVAVQFPAVVQVPAERVDGRDDEPAAGLEDAAELREDRLPVGDVVEDEVAEHQVERAVVRERQAVGQVEPAELYRVAAPLPCGGQRLPAGVDAGDVRPLFVEPLGVVADATPGVEHATAGEVGQERPDRRPDVVALVGAVGPRAREPVEFRRVPGETVVSLCRDGFVY